MLNQYDCATIVVVRRIMIRDTFRSLLLLVHYWFPVVLGWSVVLVIHQATSLPISTSGLYIYLLGICAAYSLDRIVDNTDPSRPVWLRAALFTGFLFSATVGFFLALHLSAQTFSALVLFSAITLSYAWIKRLPFAKGVLVGVVWVWAGVALSFSNHHWFAWQFWTMGVSLPMVILIACGVVLCDFKDIKTDHLQGVKSLPAMLGSRKTVIVISSLLIVATLISYREGRMELVISGALLLLITQFPRLLSLKAIGPLIVDASLAVPGVLIAFHLVS